MEVPLTHPILCCKENQVLQNKGTSFLGLCPNAGLRNFAAAVRLLLGAVNKSIKTDDDQLCLLSLRLSTCGVSSVNPACSYNTVLSVLGLASCGPSRTADTMEL